MRPGTLRRFYKEAAVARDLGILLDGKPVRTPSRRPLRVPTAALADAITAEWNAQDEIVDPPAMPLTGLANAAIDRVAPDPDSFAAGLAAYGENDLLCYRAATPDPLVRRQAELWDPLLVWARRRYDVDFEIARGIVHSPQQPATLRQLRQAVATRGPFELAGLSPLVTISGSLVLALALAEDVVGGDAAWAAASLDETWQAERWGEDAEAAKALEGRRRDFAAAHRFLTLL